jgi:hypothetical protein
MFFANKLWSDNEMLRLQKHDKHAVGDCEGCLLGVLCALPTAHLPATNALPTPYCNPLPTHFLPLPAAHSAHPWCLLCSRVRVRQPVLLCVCYCVLLFYCASVTVGGFLL